MPPAARITDLHTCPLPNHVGGPVIVGETTVIIGYMPAARVGDQLICALGPDSVSKGEDTVLIGNSPAARIGDPTSHGGKIVVGCPTVIIGSVAQVATLKTDRPFCEECERKRRAREAAAAAAAGAGAGAGAGAAHGPVAKANVGTGLHLGPGATQAKPAAAPAVIQESKPCDFDVVDIKCKHCGKEDRPIAGVKFKLDAQGKPVGDHVKSPNKKRPFLPDRFEVIADDEVTIQISGGPGYHDGKHPTITLTPPAAIGGAPVVVHGATSHDFKIAYTSGWFEQRMKGATGLGFGGAVKQLFFPPPVAYGLRVAACGSRKQGATFAALSQSIYAYPGDIFKISLSLPAFKKTERQSFSGKEGASKVTESSETISKGYHGTSQSKGEESRLGGPTQSLGVKETYTDVHGGLEHSQKLTQTPDGKLAYTNDLVASKAGDSWHKATAKSIEITRNNGSITNSFKIAEFIDFIADLRAKCMDVIDFIRGIADSSPKIGWSLSFSVELLSGSLEYSWGYKEWKDHTVYRYWKFEAALTVFSGKAEVAFGLEVLKCKAQVYGSLSCDLKVTASKEANPDQVGLAASVSAAAAPGGEIGVRGALGDWLEVIGKVTAGVEGSTKIELSPFKWTVKIELSDGKGTFVAKSKLGLSYEGKKTLWTRRDILSEKTIIG
jgi:uncharacterized Zn-binding protein involved in type VI secretion